MKDLTVKQNYIYKSPEGEYFKSIEKDGAVVLSNPSYPFVFLPGVLEPLTEVGTAEEFEHLITKQDYEFHQGETLEVEIKDGNLKVNK